MSEGIVTRNTYGGVVLKTEGRKNVPILGERAKKLNR